MTTEGTALASVLRTAFDQIEAQTRRIREKPTHSKLRIKLPPTFAIRWFVPRLARFHALNRHVDVQITTSHQEVDFDREKIDVCNHSGTAPPPRFYSRRLFGEIILPVCSPGMLRGAQTLPSRQISPALSYSARCTGLTTGQLGSTPPKLPIWTAIAASNSRIRHSHIKRPLTSSV